MELNLKENNMLFNKVTERKTCNSFSVKIYIAGPIEVAKQIIRRECLVEGLCVTIEPTLYIYSGGEEQGYVVGLINYPRFPKTPKEILDRAEEIGTILLNETFQQSFTIVTPEESLFVSKR